MFTNKTRLLSTLSWQLLTFHRMVTDDLLFVAILGTSGVEGTSAGNECLISNM